MGVSTLKAILVGKASHCILTDHQPLVSIFNNAVTHFNPRLERWAIKLEPYDVTVMHIPEKINPADYLSKNPVYAAVESRLNRDAEEHVRMVVSEVTPKGITLEELKEETKTTLCCN